MFFIAVRYQDIFESARECTHTGVLASAARTPMLECSSTAVGSVITMQPLFIRVFRGAEDGSSLQSVAGNRRIYGNDGRVVQ